MGHGKTSFDAASASARQPRPATAIEAGAEAAPEAVSLLAHAAGMSAQDAAFRPVDVECYAGYRGEETPRRFRFGEHEVEITGIVDRWLAPDHRYFKVRDAAGAVYILRHDVFSSRWELTWVESRADRGRE